MAKIDLWRCDSCGAKVKRAQRAEGAILMPEDRAVAEEAAKNATMFAALKPAKQEKFDLCTECALAMLVTFKVRKKAIQAETQPPEA